MLEERLRARRADAAAEHDVDAVAARLDVPEPSDRLFGAVDRIGAMRGEALPAGRERRGGVTELLPRVRDVHLHVERMPRPL